MWHLYSSNISSMFFPILYLLSFHDNLLGPFIKDLSVHACWIYVVHIKRGEIGVHCSSNSVDKAIPGLFSTEIKDVMNALPKALTALIKVMWSWIPLVAAWTWLRDSWGVPKPFRNVCREVLLNFIPVSLQLNILLNPGYFIFCWLPRREQWAHSHGQYWLTMFVRPLLCEPVLTEYLNFWSRNP